jgi:thiosulfate/3-mercaptopyruvate sulfurtransferase
MTVSAVAVSLWTAFIAFPADEYPRKDLLVEPAALAETAKDFIVLDARPKKAFDEGRVPGARWVDHADWAKGFGDGAAAAAWSKRIGSLGLTADSKVVVYDDNMAKDSARVWWILRYWGVKDVRLLNGGWKGWPSGGRSVEKESPPFEKTEFQASPLSDRVALKDELLKSLDAGSLQIIDARSEKEHCGLDAMKNKKAGAIPGAKHLEWSDLLDSKTHRFKPASELKSLLAAANVDLDKPTAAHCQSGGRSSVMAFGLELMGAKNVKNYHRSWSEWGNASDTPIVKPAKKARPSPGAG